MPLSNLSPSLKGVIMMFAAVFFIAAMNLTAKALQPEHHPIEILFHRNFLALILTFGVLVLTFRLNKLKTDRIRAHISRGIIGNICVVLAFATFGLLPAAEATALIFTAPLFVGILSMPLLGERVGPWRWGALMIGFIGVLIMCQPQNISSWEGVMAGLGAGFASGLVGIFLRDLGRTEDSWITVFYFLLIGCVMTGICLPFIGNMPSAVTFFLLIIAGLFGFVNQATKTIAYQKTEASLLAPILYTMLIWTMLFGWLIWDEIPTLYTLIGAGIIILANCIILWREYRMKKKENVVFVQ